jgi:hypothetical protein
MKTWKPWNPVAIKKVEPKIPSEMLKSAETYSKTWKQVKISAKTIVKTNPKTASFFVTGSYSVVRVRYCGT